MLYVYLDVNNDVHLPREHRYRGMERGGHRYVMSGINTTSYK